jgi:predicted CxxxxCH...CXXCH cytochrome family protein
MDGHGCQSAIKIVSGKFSGITCHNDGSNPGQVGDTIFVEIFDWNGSSQTCRLK